MAGEKLNLGSGDSRMPGWINLDAIPYPNVDRVWDLTKGLPYTGVSYIYAEHFIEHLAPSEALVLLKACRRALAAGGVLRLSTPNLDWVLETHYDSKAWLVPQRAVEECFALNKAFHGWGHQFLYNRQTLEALLRDAGFAVVERLSYGISADPTLRGLERHEKSPDTAEQEHVLVVEARGQGDCSDVSEMYRIDYRRDTHMPFHLLQYSSLWLIRAVSRSWRKLTCR